MLEVPTGHVPTVTTLLPASLAPHPGAGTLVLETALPPACLDAIVQLWRALPVAPKDKPSPIDRSYYADVDGWLCAALDTALVAVGLMPEPVALDSALAAVGLMPEPVAASDDGARAADRAADGVHHDVLQAHGRRGSGDGGAGPAAAAAGNAAARLMPRAALDTALELKHQQPPALSAPPPRRPPPPDYRPCGLAAKYGELSRHTALIASDGI